MDCEKLNTELSQLPLLQYEFFKPEELIFSEHVRYICQTECPMYNTTWACPPAVGSVEDCKRKCLSFPKALLITTITEIEDIANMEQALATRPQHEAITHQVETLLREQNCETYVLSTEACAICPQCAYPNAPCRHPNRMYPCVESHGIIVTDLAEKYGIDFLAGPNLVTWFSILFFREM